MINCYNLGNASAITINGYARGGLIGFIVNGNSNIINCYNSGTVVGNNKKKSGGIVGQVNSGTVNVSNCCSLGPITISPAYTFCSGGTVEFDNCYYSKKLVENNEKININEGPTEVTATNMQTTLQSLNAFVNAHKNDYEVPLVNWVIGPEGYPVLDLKY